MAKFKVGDKVTVIDCEALVDMNKLFKLMKTSIGDIDMLKPDLKGVVVKDNGMVVKYNSLQMSESYIVDFGEGYHGTSGNCLLVVGDVLKLTEESGEKE